MSLEMGKSFAATYFCLFFRFIWICYLRADLWGTHLNLVGEWEVPGDSIFFSYKSRHDKANQCLQTDMDKEKNIINHHDRKRCINNMRYIFGTCLAGKGDRWCVCVICQQENNIDTFSDNRNGLLGFFPQLFSMAHQYSTYSCFIEGIVKSEVWSSKKRRSFLLKQDRSGYLEKNLDVQFRTSCTVLEIPEWNIAVFNCIYLAEEVLHGFKTSI